MGGGDVDVPGPSKDELKLQRLQLEILRQQQRESRLLAPFLFEDVGVRPQLDSAGNIVGFEELPPTEVETLREEVETGLLERTLAALSGELPVDPALESNLADAEESLNEQLIKDFGSLSAARQSTAGIARLKEFDEFRENTREAARRGQLSLAEQLAVSEAGVRQTQEQIDFNQLTNIVGRPFGQTPTNPGAFASALGNQRIASANVAAANRGLDPFAAVLASVGGPALGRIGSRIGGVSF